MSRVCRIVLIAAACAIGLLAETTLGQYSVVSTPFQQLGDSFYENFGVGFGFNLNGGPSFTQGGMGSALPPFGGYDPGAGANLGFALNGKGGSAFFNLAMGQGSNRSLVTTVPSVVVPNGGQGMIIDATMRPFVTGLVPVVGDFSGLPIGYGMMAQPSVSPLQQKIARMNYERQHGQSRSRGEGGLPIARANDDAARRGPAAAAGPSTAEHGDLSVAEIRRRQVHKDAAQQEEALAFVERGRKAEQAEKWGVAKIFYQNAASRASGDLKQELLEKVKELDALIQAEKQYR